MPRLPGLVLGVLPAVLGGLLAAALLQPVEEGTATAATATVTTRARATVSPPEAAALCAAEHEGSPPSKRLQGAHDRRAGRAPLGLGPLAPVGAGLVRGG